MSLSHWPNRTQFYRPTALIGGKYYYAPFDITHYFSSDVRFTDIVVQSMGQSGMETKVQSANCARTMATETILAFLTIEREQKNTDMYVRDA